MRTVSHQFGVGLVIAVVVVLTIVPMVAGGQSEAMGTVVIAEDETVDSLNVVAGTVLVRGTVTGDASVVAGNIQLTESGVIQGDLSGVAGNIQLDGTVEGGVSVGAGNILIGETSVIGGNFEADAGNILIEGTIDGDASVGAESIQLGDTAMIGGSLTYEGNLDGNHDAVQGTITREPARGDSGMNELEPVLSLVFSGYAFVVNFIIGAVLLYVFSEFSTGVASQVTASPVRTGVIGLGVLIGFPIVLLAVAITIVGIPLAIIGIFGGLLLAWVGMVYGRYAVGVWLLGSFSGSENDWIALALGLFAGAILAVIPVIGGFVNFVIFLLGLGALSHRLYGQRHAITPR